MSTPKINVSFCIPTRNRSAFIGDTLDSIVSQAGEGVEIVVVDGGSDDTEQVVRKRAQVFQRLKYARSVYASAPATSPTHWSEGFEMDCDQAVRLAEGSFCWLFPDDDVLRPGAVARVLEAIAEGHSLVVVNAEIRTRDLGQVLQGARLGITQDRTYAPDEQDSLLLDTAVYLSYMGGVVLRRDLWAPRRALAPRTTGFPHVAVIFQSRLPGSALAISDPWITIRYGNAQWYPRAFEIWMLLWPRLIWSIGCVSEATKAKVTVRVPWRMPRRLLKFRALGAYSVRDYDRWIRPEERSPVVRAWTRLVAAVPGRLVNLAALGFTKLLRGGSLLEIADLRASPFYLPPKALSSPEDGDCVGNGAGEVQ